MAESRGALESSALTSVVGTILPVDVIAATKLCDAEHVSSHLQDLIA